MLESQCTVENCSLNHDFVNGRVADLLQAKGVKIEESLEVGLPTKFTFNNVLIADRHKGKVE